MAYIRIRFEDVADAERYLRGAIGALEEAAGELQTVRRRLPAELDSRYRIADRLERCRRDAAAAGRKSRELKDTVNDGMQKYKRLEASLKKSAPSGNDVYGP